MNICVYTETFENIDAFILGFLDRKHTLTIISSETLELPKSYWILGLENPDRISGSFFIAEKGYCPRVQQFNSISYIFFDLILRCSNVKDFSPMEQHAVDSNIPILDFDPGDEIDLEKFKKENKELFEYKQKEGDPLISIITVVNKTVIDFLRDCAISVNEQVYKRYEWIIIIGDATPIIFNEISKAVVDNDKAKIFFKQTDDPIGEGLEQAIGDYITFLDINDLLESKCLFEIATFAKNNPEDRAFYTNHKVVDINNSIVRDVRKPDFDLELFYQHDYLDCMKVVKRIFWEKSLRLPNPEYKSVWDYEWFLRIAENYWIGHCRKLVYRKRGESEFSINRNPTGDHLALQAVRKSNERTKLVYGNIVASGNPFYFKIRRYVQPVKFTTDEIRLLDQRVKILILTKKNPMHIKLLIDSIQREVNIDYKVVVTQHVDEEDKNMTEFLKTIDYKVNKCDIKGFNFAKLTNWQIENGVEKGDDYVMILNDDLIFQNDCAYEMVACSQAFEAGIVGCKLIWPGKSISPKLLTKNYLNYSEDVGNIQHCGVELNSDKCCAHRYYGFATNILAANFAREMDAVTFACAMIRRDLIDEIKFDKRLPIDYNDIDFCIQARQKGHKVYYTPWAVALHFESATKEMTQTEDFIYFEAKHRDYLRQFPTFEQRKQDMLQGL